jgi:hypothetical protein
MSQKDSARQGASSMKRRSVSKNQYIEPEPRPSALTMFSAVVVVLAVSFVGATGSYALLRDPIGFILVFVFVLLIMVTIIPYFLLSTAFVNQSTWFKSYVLVLERIPGIEVIIKMILGNIQRR